MLLLRLEPNCFIAQLVVFKMSLENCVCTKSKSLITTSILIYCQVITTLLVHSAFNLLLLGKLLLMQLWVDYDCMV